MKLTSSQSERLAGRFALLGLLAIACTLPFAVPALWDFAQVKLNMERGLYLTKPVDSQTFHLEFALVAVALPAFLWRMFAPPSSFHRNSILWIAALFVAVEAASVFQSTSVGFAFRQFLLPLALIAVLVLAEIANLGSAGVEKVLLVALATSIPTGLYAVAQSHGWEFLPYSMVKSEVTMEELTGKQLVSSTFGHPNYLASYLAPLLFWGLYFGLSRRARLHRAIGFSASVVILMALVASGARGAWLACIVAAVPFYLLLTFSPMYRAQLVAAAVMGALLALALLFLPIPFFRVQFNVGQRLLASKEIAARLYYWLIALQMFLQHPWLGVGYANFNVLFWDAVQVFQRAPGSDFYKFILTEDIRGVSPGFVHNDFLQFAVESGIVAIAAWLALWSALICQTWEAARRSRRDPRALLMAATFLASFTAFAIDALFNFPFHIPVSGFLFWTLVAGWVCVREELVSQSA